MYNMKSIGVGGDVAYSMYKRFQEKRTIGEAIKCAKMAVKMVVRFLLGQLPALEDTTQLEIDMRVSNGYITSECRVTVT